jgi:MFS family permease
VARATSGIGYALLLIAVLPEAWAGGERRTGRAGTALLAAAFAIAQVCAPPLGGVIADTVGPRAVFLLAALLVLGAGGIAAAMLDERRPAGDGPRVRFLGAPAEPPAPTRRQRALVWSAAVAGTVARFEFGGFLLAALPLWLTATNHSTASIGRYQMVLGLLPILFIPLFRKLAWRSNSYQLLLVLAVALAAGGTVPFLRPAILPGQLAGLGMIAAGITLGLTVQQVAVTRARRLMELRTFVPPTPLPLLALERAALPAGPLAAALLLQLRGAGFALAMLAGVFIAGAAAFALVRACAGREDA